MTVTQLVGLIALLSFVGVLAGFAGGLFGIGGGIIIVPALYAAFGMVEVPLDTKLTLAIGTSLAVIIITSLRSVSAHHKAGHVDMSVLKSWIVWIGFGAFAAGFLAAYIPTRMLTLVFAGCAAAIGVVRIMQSLTVNRRAQLEDRPSTADNDQSHASEHVPWLTRLAPILGLGTGLVSGVLGIGGGVIGVMVLGWAGRPVHQAIGTASGFGVGVAIPGTIGFIISGLGNASLPLGAIGFVHAPAFAILGLMTLITAPIGARAAHRLSAAHLYRLFGAYVIIMALFMAREALS